jgi:hypothetical protein
VRLQEDVETFPIVMRESGSDVQPVIILFGTLYDRIGSHELFAFIGDDAPTLHLRVLPAQRPAGTPREHEQAAARVVRAVYPHQQHPSGGMP